MTTDEKIAYLEGRIEELSKRLDALMIARAQHEWPVTIHGPVYEPYPYQPCVVTYPYQPYVVTS